MCILWPFASFSAYRMRNLDQCTWDLAKFTCFINAETYPSYKKSSAFVSATHRGPCINHKHQCGITPFGGAKMLFGTIVASIRAIDRPCLGKTSFPYLSLMIGRPLSKHYSGVVVPQLTLTRSFPHCYLCLSAIHSDFLSGS